MSRIFKNLIYQLVSVLIIISAGSSQRTAKVCELGTPCKPLVECKEMLDLARSTDFTIRKKFLDSICGFMQIILVCCPNETPTTPVFPSGEDLLPKDCGTPPIDDRIIGGRPAPIGGYPWMVALGYTELGIRGSQYLCSGSLINNRYVLTAAHCLHPSSLGAKMLSVINLGDWDLSTTEDCQVNPRGMKCYPPHIEAKPEKIILHPSYSKRAVDSDDIALIRLDRTISFNSLDTAPVHPVCLPSEKHSARSLAQGRNAVAAGWGFTEHGNRSDILLRVGIPFADDKLCRDHYKSKFVSNQLCLGGVKGEDTCNGDSGAPLVIPGPRGPPFLQIGIVSYGALPCALDKVPAVYTAVSEYIGWIKQNLRP